MTLCMGEGAGSIFGWKWDIGQIGVVRENKRNLKTPVKTRTKCYNVNK
jgi:hypothetical protein